MATETGREHLRSGVRWLIDAEASSVTHNGGAVKYIETYDEEAVPCVDVVC